MCWDDLTRLYASTHERGIFRGVSAYAERLISSVLNRPLSAGAGSAEFRRAWTELLEAVDRFEPEAIFLSAGFDAHADEELVINLADDDYDWITRQAVALAGDRLLVSVLEAGTGSTCSRDARGYLRRAARRMTTGPKHISLRDLSQLEAITAVPFRGHPREVAPAGVKEGIVAAPAPESVNSHQPPLGAPRLSGAPVRRQPAPRSPVSLDPRGAPAFVDLAAAPSQNKNREHEAAARCREALRAGALHHEPHAAARRVLH